MSTAQIFQSEAKRAGNEFIDADGNTYVYLYVPSACTLLTPYSWYTVDSSQRPVQTALSSADAIGKVVVAMETLTAAGYAKFQVKGWCDGIITPSITGVTTQTLKLASGAVAAGGAATITPDDFAIVETGATAAVFDVYLLGREITPS